MPLFPTDQPNMYLLFQAFVLLLVQGYRGIGGGNGQPFPATFPTPGLLSFCAIEFFRFPSYAASVLAACFSNNAAANPPKGLTAPDFVTCKSFEKSTEPTQKTTALWSELSRLLLHLIGCGPPMLCLSARADCSGFDLQPFGVYPCRFSRLTSPTCICYSRHSCSCLFRGIGG